MQDFLQICYINVSVPRRAFSYFFSGNQLAENLVSFLKEAKGRRRAFFWDVLDVKNWPQKKMSCKKNSIYGFHIIYIYLFKYVCNVYIYICMYECMYACMYE